MSNIILRTTKTTTVLLFAAMGAATITSACAGGSPITPRVVTAEIGRVPSMPLATAPSSSTSTVDRGGNDGDGDAIEVTGTLTADDDPVGLRAPGFSADSLEQNGKPTRLLKRKITVLHFWATWCAPCQVAMPKLDKLQAKYGARGVMTIGVSVDDEKKGVLTFAKDNKVTFPIGWDRGHEISERYKVSTMPQTFVIDREGVIRAVFQGYHDGDDHQIEKLLKTLL
jgi:cytochrome c biogenesis protein CcmG, thiol:disulfide interchange protein DsbE